MTLALALLHSAVALALMLLALLTLLQIIKFLVSEVIAKLFLLLGESKFGIAFESGRKTCLLIM
jgi:hypothetical protein